MERMGWRIALPPNEMKLHTKYVEKPWGRSRLPEMFEQTPERKIGEVWFVADASLSLLAKYLFTSEKLSVQVHPGDEEAKARGLPRGKSECWYILDAEPDATIGLGLCREVGEEELRAAALDGSIVDLIDWRPIAAGDFVYIPAGTKHAIGSGISLVEFQENSDATYRLYDYGRPRELHLDDAIAVARRSPYSDNLFERVPGDADCILVDGPEFALLHSRSDNFQNRRRWILPLEGTVRLGSDAAGPGECLLAEPGEQAHSDGARMLIGSES